MSLAKRIDAVRATVASAAAKAGRSPAEVTIVAVTKMVDRAAVDAAYGLGLRHFGENRVQDALEKFDPAKGAVPSLPADATLHLIGRLQTNKVKPAARLFQVIESVDRASLIEALSREGERLGRTLPILLQVNVAGEEQKAGCAPADAAELIATIRSFPHLDPLGLMTIAPLVEDAEEARPVFRGLRELRDELRCANPGLRLDVLSMGMTNDYPVAIEEGATHVRIGRAIFGG